MTLLHQIESRIQGLFMMFSVIFCLFNNFTIAIVKTIQFTVFCRQTRILTQLQNEILVKFQIIKYHRCLFSYQLVDYIFDQVSRSVNFLQIPKAIAQLHINTYCRLYTTFQGNDAYNKALENVMFSFPSSGKVKDVFLDVFKVRKEQYQLDMESIPVGSMIAADATFKISKATGFRRKEDNKIVHQYNNLFIVLNG